MIRLASFVVVVLGLALVVGAVDTKEATPLGPEPAGMVQLFNGKDLAGWDGDPKLWSVKDGVIHGETTPTNAAKGNTFLIWKGGTVKDFELRAQFRLSEANNSGIQYRSKHKPFKETDVNKWGVAGYQCEIRNESKLPNVSAFIYDEGGKRGRLVLVGEKAVWEEGKKTVVSDKLCTAEDFAKAMKVGDWNEVVIIAKGNNIKQYINGLQTIDFTDKQEGMALTDGILALQLHAGKAFWVEFKNVRLKQN